MFYHLLPSHSCNKRDVITIYLRVISIFLILPLYWFQFRLKTLINFPTFCPKLLSSIPASSKREALWLSIAPGDPPFNLAGQCIHVFMEVSNPEHVSDRSSPCVCHTWVGGNGIQRRIPSSHHQICDDQVYPNPFFCQIIVSVSGVNVIKDGSMFLAIVGNSFPVYWNSRSRHHQPAPISKSFNFPFQVQDDLFILALTPSFPHEKVTKIQRLMTLNQ